MPLTLFIFFVLKVCLSECFCSYILIWLCCYFFCYCIVYFTKHACILSILLLLRLFLISTHRATNLFPEYYTME